VIEMATFRVEETLRLVFEIEASSAEEAMEKWGQANSDDASEHETQRVTVIGEDGEVLEDDF
jgi:hypothetical protein